MEMGMDVGKARHHRLAVGSDTFCRGVASKHICATSHRHNSVGLHRNGSVVEHGIIGIDGCHCRAVNNGGHPHSFAHF